ncbi:MAG: hypothetical protein RI947_881 [Candidatus Parcubacteria bacterium]|jgi:5'-nucleotidase
MDRDNIIPTMNYKEATITMVKEKLPYLVTGFVVLVMLFLLTTILYVRNIIPYKPFVSKPSNESQPAKLSSANKTYSVQTGDSLWDIAEAQYHNGFMWETLAKANNISEPYIVYSNQKLTIPHIKAAVESGQISAIQTGKVTQTQATYVIKQGDSLWSIAEASYGDGNLWTRIAEANNLVDAGTIHVDNTLIIPR